MKEYTVKVVERHSKTVKVMASSETEAKALALLDSDLPEFECIESASILDSTNIDEEDN